MVESELAPTSALAALMAANRRMALRSAEPAVGIGIGRGPTLAVVGWLDKVGDAAAAHAAIELFGSVGARVSSLGGSADEPRKDEAVVERIVAAVGNGARPLVVVLAADAAGAESRVFAAVEAVILSGGGCADRLARRELRIVGGIVERSCTPSASEPTGHRDPGHHGPPSRVRWLGEHPGQTEILSRVPRRDAR